MQAEGTPSLLSAGLTIGGITVAIPQGNPYQGLKFDPMTGDAYGDLIEDQDFGRVIRNGLAQSLELDARSN